MARRISGVGCVTVSLRKSTILGRCFSAIFRGDDKVSSLDWGAKSKARLNLESLNSIRYGHQRTGLFLTLICGLDKALENLVG